VWVCCLPDECEAEAVGALARALLAAAGSAGTVEAVLMSDHPGSATLRLSDSSTAKVPPP
jgi:hypothetical protein